MHSFLVYNKNYLIKTYTKMNNIRDKNSEVE